MLTVLAILWVASFLLTIGSAMGKVPLWIPVLLISIAGCLTVIPLGK